MKTLQEEEEADQKLAGVAESIYLEVPTGDEEENEGKKEVSPPSRGRASR